MRLVSRLLPAPRRTEERGVVQLYPTWASPTERVLVDVRGAYTQNSTVHAVINARLKVFSEVRFTWRRYRDGTLFSDDRLALLERPWPGGTGTELLSRMELDASLTGNAYVLNTGEGMLQVLEPFNVEIVSDGRQKTGYLYWPDGIGSGRPQPLGLGEVAHWAPLPHPDRQWLGVSWVEVVMSELRTDAKMVRHQERFLDNAATPNMVVTLEGKMTADGMTRLKEMLDRRYSGVENAYRTLVMDSGARVQMVGADMQQMDYVSSVKSLEARIASAGGVPPIVVGLKAGLDASTYSNYALAMRAFADHTIRPNWNSAVAALNVIVPTTREHELWYDDRHVAALRQDKQVESQIQQTWAQTIRSYVDGGFTPDSAVLATVNGDPTLLEHTGLYSVQLQPAGTNNTEDQIEAGTINAAAADDDEESTDAVASRV